MSPLQMMLQLRAEASVMVEGLRSASEAATSQHKQDLQKMQALMSLAVARNDVSLLQGVYISNQQTKWQAWRFSVGLCFCLWEVALGHCSYVVYIHICNITLSQFAFPLRLGWDPQLLALL